MDLECVICFNSFGEEAKSPTPAHYYRAKGYPGHSSSSSTRGNKTDQLGCTPCGHLFHDACIRDRVKKRGTCPNCRTPFGAQDLKPVFLPTLDKEKSMVVKFETSISEEAKRQMSTHLKGIIDLQKAELDAEKAKTVKAEKENKKLEETITELRWQLTSVMAKVEQEQATRKEAEGRYAKLQKITDVFFEEATKLKKDRTATVTSTISSTSSRTYNQNGFVLKSSANYKKVDKDDGSSDWSD